jgi:hypothetical protein
LKIYKDTNGAIVSVPPEDRHVKGNRIKTLYGGKDITHNRFMGAHDLPDMFLVRDICADGFFYIGHRIDDPASRINTGDAFYQPCRKTPAFRPGI